MAQQQQQQRKFSSRFLPDAKRKSRPKSLPVANNPTPLPRSNTNPLTRVKCLDDGGVTYNGDESHLCLF